MNWVLDATSKELNKSSIEISNPLLVQSSPAISERVRPNSDGTFIQPIVGNNCYYIPVLKGQMISYSGTNSAAKTIVFCFSENIPVVGGSMTNYEEHLETTEIEKSFIAPYDGYFTAYHNYNYFIDQIFKVNNLTTCYDSILESPDAEYNFNINYATEKFTATADYVVSCAWNLHAGDMIKIIGSNNTNQTRIFLLNSINYVEDGTPDFVGGDYKWMVSLVDNTIYIPILQDCYMFVTMKSSVDRFASYRPIFLGKNRILTSEEINTRLVEAEDISNKLKEDFSPFYREYIETSSIYRSILNNPDVENNFGIGWSTQTYTATADYIVSCTWNLHAGDRIYIKRSSSNYAYVYLLNSINYVEGGTPDFIDGDYKFSVVSDLYIDIKQDCYMLVTMKSSTSSSVIFKPAVLDKCIALTAEDIIDNSSYYDSILESPDTENNFSISYNSDVYTATVDYVCSAVWNLHTDDKIKVVGREDGNDVMIYLLNSINYVEGATPDYIEGTHKWKVFQNDLNLRITQDCYLFVAIRSTSNPNTWWKPSFLGKKELLTAEEINTRLNDLETSYIITRNVELQGGDLNNNGNVKKVTTSRGEYMNFLNTPMFINAVEIKSINVEQGETVTFYCYTTDFSYIGQTSNLSLLDNTKWVKIKLEKQTEYVGTKSLNITYVTNGFEDAKNTRTALTRFTYSYEIQSPVFDEAVSSELPNIDNVRHFDNGMLILPPNYSNTGEPVRLVIFAHGTGGFGWTSSGSYTGLLEFVAKNGYAVCDCCGMSDKYSIGNLTPPISDARHNLMSISCYCNLYKFLIKNYNLMEDGCFMFGKSNGGIATTFMSLAQPIPIIASAGLAPSISIIESLRYTRGGSLQYWTDRLGLDIDCSNVATQTYLYSVESSNQNIVNYLKANANVFSRIDPFIMQTDIDANQIATAFFAHGYLEANQEVEQIISNSKKWQTCPMKIFHALDDQSVPYQISRWYIDMCKKINSSCFLRTIPSGLGGHHAVDTSSLAPKVNFTTKFGETVEIVVTYAELVEWFNRW